MSFIIKKKLIEFNSDISKCSIKVLQCWTPQFQVIVVSTHAHVKAKENIVLIKGDNNCFLKYFLFENVSK
jgi:hypothetical protein